MSPDRHEGHETATTVESTTAWLDRCNLQRTNRGWGESPAGGLVRLFVEVGAGAVGVVVPALGHDHPGARRALATARGAQLGDGEGLGRVELGQQPVEVGERVDEAEGAAHLAAGGEALEVP